MNVQKLTAMSLFVAAAMMLSYIESLFPFFFGVPGMKLGLANLAAVIALYGYGWREALLVNVLRITLMGLLFGNLFSILFSLGGAVFSFAGMMAAKRVRLSLCGVSMAGGAFHNVGQLAIAAFLVRNLAVGHYAAVLLPAGLLTGFLIGVVAKEMLKRLTTII